MATVTGLAEALADKLAKTETAVSANKLAAPFTLELTGDVTGQVSLDGSKSVSLSVTVKDNQQDNQWQPGDIKMFAGSINQIQSGWQLCNGSGTTSNGIQIPDLRNRMIIGAGSSYSTGNTGGSTSATTNSAGSHSHSISVKSTTLSISQMPQHNHNIITRGGTDNDEIDNVSGHYWGTGKLKSLPSSYKGDSVSHSHSGSSSSSGSHSHSVSIMPPYYALAFIIKL